MCFPMKNFIATFKTISCNENMSIMTYSAYNQGHVKPHSARLVMSLGIPSDPLRIPAKLNSHSGQREHPDP